MDFNTAGFLILLSVSGGMVAKFYFRRKHLQAAAAKLEYCSTCGQVLKEKK